jgi:anti-sigma regulatory factor (Ser/Thr protein kinase)
MGRASASIRKRLAADPRAPRSARGAIERACRDLSSDLAYWVKLLVSELVTNAVTHGQAGNGDQVELRVQTSPARVRVEVDDEGSGFDRLLRAPSLRGSGWGLFLVERLSDRWGVSRRDGTCVWFEMDRGAWEAA